MTTARPRSFGPIRSSPNSARGRIGSRTRAPRRRCLSWRTFTGGNSGRLGSPSIHEAVELGRIVADDLSLHIGRGGPALLLDVFLRVGIDAVGVREIRTPHDVVGAELIDQFHADRIALIRRVALAV